MASKAKVTQMLAGVRTLYPQFYDKGTDVGTLVAMWTKLLSDYSDEEAATGLYEAMRVCKYPPTPAEVIEQIERLRAALQPTEAEMVEMLSRALDEVYRQTAFIGSNYDVGGGVTLSQLAQSNISRVYCGLPQEIRDYVGSEAALVTKAERTRSDKELAFEENRFRKALPTLRQQMRYKQAAARLTAPEQKRIEG